MKMLLTQSIQWILTWIIALRYKVEVEGLDEISKTRGKDGKGHLFLPNHPSVFIDPMIVTVTILKKFNVRPVVVDFMYNMPVVNTFLKLIKAVSIPNFGTSINSHKVRRMHLALSEVVKGLKRGEDFLLYPAGKVKGGMKEEIGGASGLHEILEQAGDIEIILVRTTGLWGSHFSRAYSSKTPPVGSTLLVGLKATLKNLIFFNPKRKVKIFFEKLPADFPWNGEKFKQNQFLENWYNEKDDLLTKVPYSRFCKEPKWPQEKRRGIEYEGEIDIPPHIRDGVYAKLNEISGYPIKDMKEEMSLSADLGMDSLSVAEVSLFLEETFEVKELSPDNLVTVGDVLVLATKEITPQLEEKPIKGLNKWLKKGASSRAVFKGGETILEAVLKTADRFPTKAIVADEASGVLTYRDLKARVILLREIFLKMPGDHVGILLPSSVAALVCILACMAAKKVPVMVNWTLGSRLIESIEEQTNMKTAVTAWSFLDRLAHVNLGSLTDKLVQLEDLRSEIGIGKKIKAAFYSHFSAKSLLKKWGYQRVKGADRAVILFTSGSEGMPKGVPLSHHNFLSNIKGTNASVELFEDDIFFSILPPFHSYGLTVSSLAGPILSLKTAFSPNPNEAHKISRGVFNFKGTILCGAPTFLRRILKASKPDELKSIRLLVSGAEKATEELFDLARQHGLDQTIIEGYGVTECSPILTFNRPGEEPKGVGKPIDGVSIKIVHPETKDPVPKNQVGLVLASGENVFSGYLNSTLTSPFLTMDGKVWYKTGDLGFLDEQGRLTLVGRQKRFIKIGGEMLSLASLEQVLTESYPKPGSDEEGPVFAVTSKETEGDIRPRIFLFTTLAISLDEANRLLKKGGFSNLARFASVYKLSEIPILGTGKVDYKKLEAELLH